jgi:hypothetical protein
MIIPGMWSPSRPNPNSVEKSLAGVIRPMVNLDFVISHTTLGGKTVFNGAKYTSIAKVILSGLF